MNAISNHQNSLFLNSATSTRPLTTVWHSSFPVPARSSDAAAPRRSLRRREPEVSEWQEVAVRVALTVSIVGAYAAAAWQLSAF